VDKTVWQETIQINGPYNFDGVLARRSLDPLQSVDLESKTLKIPLYIETKPVVVEIKSLGTTDQPSFQLTSQNDQFKEQAINRVKHILQWNTPLMPIHEHFSQTDLQGIFQAHYGTPLVLDFDPYRSIIRCIIHQQLNLSFAFKLTERFVHTYGFQQEGVWFHPLPDKIATLAIEDLRALQFSGRKAEYTIGVSRKIINGELDLDTLQEKSEEEIFEQLIKLKGIGPWTIQNLLLFGYGKSNLFPAADIGIQNALKKLYKLDRKPTLEEMNQYKISWEPYLSYASLYLWRSIE
jgi:DNA-3-methyladenine glycosylase II